MVEDGEQPTERSNVTQRLEPLISVFTLSFEM